ncbi:hypothetical protein ACFQV8_40385 [Pseudonocardia benzenivorans]
MDEIGGEYVVLACEDEVLLSPGDVHYMCWQSGGGYGDPAAARAGAGRARCC